MKHIGAEYIEEPTPEEAVMFKNSQIIWNKGSVIIWHDHKLDEITLDFVDRGLRVDIGPRDWQKLRAIIINTNIPPRAELLDEDSVLIYDDEFYRLWASIYHRNPNVLITLHFVRDPYCTLRLRYWEWQTLKRAMVELGDEIPKGDQGVMETVEL